MCVFYGEFSLFSGKKCVQLNRKGGVKAPMAPPPPSLPRRLKTQWYIQEKDTA